MLCLVSAVQQSDSVVYFFFIFFPLWFITNIKYHSFLFIHPIIVASANPKLPPLTNQILRTQQLLLAQ